MKKFLASEGWTQPKVGAEGTTIRLPATRDGTLLECLDGEAAGIPCVRDIEIPATEVFVDGQGRFEGPVGPSVALFDTEGPWIDERDRRSLLLTSPATGFGKLFVKGQVSSTPEANTYVRELNEESTIFANLIQLRSVAEGFSGRKVHWGNNGQLRVVLHDTTSEGSSYNRDARELRLAVVREGTNLVSEASTDVVYHEGAHAVSEALRRRPLDGTASSAAWEESFADQSAIFAALQQPQRRAELIEEAGRDQKTVAHLLRGRNSLSTISTTIRDLRRDASQMDSRRPVTAAERNELEQELQGRIIVSDTQTALNEPALNPFDFGMHGSGPIEPHVASKSLTSATYEAFSEIYWKQVLDSKTDDDALKEAARVMGVLQHRVQNGIGNEFIETLSTVAAGYLAADIEYFGGAHLQELSDAFVSRKLLTLAEVQEAQAKFAGPRVKIASIASHRKPSLDDFSHVDLNARDVKKRLGIPDDFKLVTKPPAVAESDPNDPKKKRYILTGELHWTDGDGNDMPTRHEVTVVIREDGTIGLWGSSVATREQYDRLRFNLGDNNPPGKYGTPAGIYVDPLRL